MYCVFLFCDSHSQVLASQPTGEQKHGYLNLVIFVTTFCVLVSETKAHSKWGRVLKHAYASGSSVKQVKKKRSRDALDVL